LNGFQSLLFLLPWNIIPIITLIVAAATLVAYLRRPEACLQNRPGRMKKGFSDTLRSSAASFPDIKKMLLFYEYFSPGCRSNIKGRASIPEMDGENHGT